MMMKYLKIPALLVAASMMIGCGEKSEPQPETPQAPATLEKVEPVAPAEKEDEPAPVSAPESIPLTKLVPAVVPVPQVQQPDQASAPKVDTTEPFVLESLDQIKVHEGSDSPKVGDTIYTYSNLPQEACGTYWVMGDNGFVETLAVCSGDHEH